MYLFFILLRQDRQCTYNVILNCIRELFLPWKSNKNYTFVCVCARASGWVSACVRVWVGGRVTGRVGLSALVALFIQHATHARLWHLWPLWLHHIFRHCLTNGTIFEENVLSLKCGFWFFLQLSSKNISNSNTNLVTYWYKCRSGTLLRKIINFFQLISV